MSEEDYQRGLRGGDCPVSISDWERWSDWKDGNRAYEHARELDALAHVAAAHAESADHKTNLGDHECPYCLQVSLKRGASRCPLCRGEIADAYWSAIRAREQTVAEETAAAKLKADEASAVRTRAAEQAAAAVVTLAVGMCRRKKRLKERQALTELSRRQPKGLIASLFGAAFAREAKGATLAPSEFCGYSISEWKASTAGTWLTQPVLTLCGGRQFRFVHPREYIAALLRIKALGMTGDSINFDRIMAQY